MRLHLLITADRDPRYAGIVGLYEERFCDVQGLSLTTCSAADSLAKGNFQLANPCGPMKGGTP